MMAHLTENFTSGEFKCPCGCGAENIDPKLVTLLQATRSRLGMAIRITSGVRCAAHNAAVGGSSESAHIPYDAGDGVPLGRAADIACETSSMRYDLLRLCLGTFRRIGIGDGFLHLDIDARKPQGVVWDYYK